MSRIKNTKRTQQSTEKIKCLSCGKDQTLDKYYLSNNEFHKLTGRHPVCKICLKEKLDVNDLTTVKDLLLELNRPFINSVWMSALEEANARNMEPFGIYIKNIQLNFKDLTWKDSLFDDQNIQKNFDNITSSSPKRPSEFIVTSEMKEKWGLDYKPHQYKKLEEFYNDMKRSYEIETASHKDYLQKICKISLKMEEAIDEGKIDQFKKLSDAYDKLMHSAKFTAVQRSAADRTGGLNTFSEFYEFIEKEGFIPKFHNDEPMDIVDATINNLKEFTRRLVLGDPNISSIVEDSISRINEKEDQNDEDNSNYDEDIYIDIDDEEVDV